VNSGQGDVVIMDDISSRKSLRLLVLAVAGLIAGSAQADEVSKSSATAIAAPTTAAQLDGVFARVGNTVITFEEYERALGVAARQKFYHGTPPQKEVAELQRLVGENMVNSVLLTDEARRRGILPDPERVRNVLKGYEEKYQGNEEWKKTRDQILPKLTKGIESQSMISKLEEAVRGSVPAPTEEQIKRYYESNQDKFTEPEQFRISVILLKVDPSGGSAAFEKALVEAKGIEKNIREGVVTFADVAKLRSGDESAENGGDMGYLHKGILPGTVQEVLEKLKPDMLSEPFMVLDGVAILRYDSFKPAKLRTFTEARERAAALLKKEQSDLAWVNLLLQLRKNTPIKIDESRYVPLVAVDAGSKADTAVKSVAP